MVEDERLIVRCPSCTQKGTPDELWRYCEQNCRAVEPVLAAGIHVHDAGHPCNSHCILADPPEELSPAVRRVADQIARGARLFSDPEAVAAVICSSGDIAAGLAALSVLEQLRERHTKRSWGDLAPGPQAVVVVCAACNVAWPCTDAEILGVA